MTKHCACLLVFPLALALSGCGGGGKGNAPISQEVIGFQKQLGEYLYAQAGEISPGARSILVMAQKEQGVMTRPDQQKVLESLQASGQDVRVAEIALEHLSPGLGVATEAYNDALAGQRVDAVISLVGIPLGDSLSAPGRNTPLLVVLEPGVPTDLLQSQGRFPTKWRLLVPKNTSSLEDPASSYDPFSSP